MKKQCKFSLSNLILAVFFALVVFLSCKKDDNDSDNGSIPPLYLNEHVVKIIGYEAGVFEYKEEYHYEEGKLIEYNYYRYDEKEDWKESSRHTYEYPSNDIVVEYTEIIADSSWYYTSKVEKKYEEKNLVEVIFYQREDNINAWRPKNKKVFTYEQDKLLESRSFWFQGTNWKSNYKDIYEYQGTLCSKIYHYINRNGSWDTAARYEYHYNAGILSDFEVYKYHIIGGWTLSLQYLLNYEGNLLSSFVINESINDSIIWEQTLSITYNMLGNPLVYSIQSRYHPNTRFEMTYEEGKGNFQRATRECSAYIIWPWFPPPVE